MSTTNTETRWITIAEAAARADRTVRTVTRWVENNDCPRNGDLVSQEWVMEYSENARRIENRARGCMTEVGIMRLALATVLTHTTQADFSRQYNVSRKVLGHILRGGKFVHQETYDAINNALLNWMETRPTCNAPKQANKPLPLPDSGYGAEAPKRAKKDPVAAQEYALTNVKPLTISYLRKNWYRVVDYLSSNGMVIAASDAAFVMVDQFSEGSVHLVYRGAKVHNPNVFSSVITSAVCSVFPDVKLVYLDYSPRTTWWQRFCGFLTQCVTD